MQIEHWCAFILWLCRRSFATISILGAISQTAECAKINGQKRWRRFSWRSFRRPTVKNNNVYIQVAVLLLFLAIGENTILKPFVSLPVSIYFYQLGTDGHHCPACNPARACTRLSCMYVYVALLRDAWFYSNGKSSTRNIWTLEVSVSPCFLMEKPESSKGYKKLTISSILMLLFSVVPIND